MAATDQLFYFIRGDSLLSWLPFIEITMKKISLVDFYRFLATSKIIFTAVCKTSSCLFCFQFCLFSGNKHKLGNSCQLSQSDSIISCLILVINEYMISTKCYLGFMSLVINFRCLSFTLVWVKLLISIFDPITRLQLIYYVSCRVSKCF